MGKKIIETGTITLFLILLSQPVLTSGDNWIETFDTKDSLNNWQITTGNWTVENGIMKSTECEDSVSGCKSGIIHSQTHMTGTWAFDMHDPMDSGFGVLFLFVGFHTDPLDSHVKDGYGIHRWSNGDIDLDYVKNKNYQFSIGSYKVKGDASGWQKIEITRDLDGNMKVYLNGAKIIDEQHNEVDRSEHIYIPTFSLGAEFDNVSYNEEIKPDPEANGDNGFLYITMFEITLTFAVIISIIRYRRIRS